MANNDLGKLRRSSILMLFGPGAIVDFRAEGAPVSAVVAGLEEWDRNFKPEGLANPQQIFEPRLQRDLNVMGFRLPPVVDEDWRDVHGRPDTRSLVAVRFPEWLQCPKCDRIAPSYKWKSDPGRAYRYCPQCTAREPGNDKVFVVPVRFIMACENGHIDDFPWHYWVGHAPECNKNRGFLELKSLRPGLAGLIVRCPECGASHSLDHIFSSDTWNGFKCNGKRPWIAGDNQACDKQPRAVQRGASNLYFPMIESALSIPPWSDRIQEALGIYWSTIVNVRDKDRLVDFIKTLSESNPDFKNVMAELNISPEELVKRINKRLSIITSNEKIGIRQEEYRQFVSEEDKYINDREFEIRNVNIPEKIEDYFNNIVRVVRLREVRVIRGFTRINPPDRDEKSISVLSLKKLDWLPAIEVRGEGIFLTLNRRQLLEWEKNAEVQKRAAVINASWREEYVKRFGEGEPTRVITPRFVLIHTFSHALMKKLSMECGYSSASLRERLYVSEGDSGMAGLMIYTATSDSDGTLGGLQRQGEAKRLARIIPASIKDMEWCSSDPLCINNMVAAPENHSRAACHACCLAPETACEEFNRFLDRAMLIGLPGMPEVGFMSRLLGGR